MKTFLEMVGSVERESNQKLNTGAMGKMAGPDPAVQRELKNHGVLYRAAKMKSALERKKGEPMNESRKPYHQPTQAIKNRNEESKKKWAEIEARVNAKSEEKDPKQKKDEPKNEEKYDRQKDPNYPAYKETRLKQIAVKRLANKTARDHGFKNMKEMDPTPSDYDPNQEGHWNRKTYGESLNEAKEYGSDEWHHEMFHAARNKGIDFEHKKTARGHELQAKSPEHEVKLEAHLHGWLHHEGQSSTTHAFRHPKTGTHTFLHRGTDKDLTDKLRAQARAQAEHDSWSSGQHFDRMVGRYSGGKTRGGPYTDKKGR